MPLLLLSKSVSPTESEARRPFEIPYLDLLVAVLVFARCAWIFGALFRTHGLPLDLAQDDFYYYLKPAQNLAWHHRSAFFENTLTNGYHPLYFLLLTVVSFFVKTLPGIFRFLWVLDILSAMTVFFLSRRIFRQVCGTLLANGLAVLMTALCFTQICDQMEVTLALPLGFAFLLTAFVHEKDLTAPRAALMGLLGALTCLARLDAGLLVVLYVFGMLCSGRYRRHLTPPAVAAFLGASLPLPLLYVAINHHFFGTLLPISGMAKELRHGHAPSFYLPGSFSGTSELLVNTSLLSMVLGWALRRYLAARERVFLFAVLVAPFLFYGLEMLISDWPVWNWYFYILRFAAAGTALLLAVLATRAIVPARYPALQRLAHGSLLAGAICLLALAKLYVANYKVDQWMVEIQHASGILDTFAAAHPGIYAMGDRAGMFAITTPNPVLQTEGLVMDRAFLSHIRSQDDLRSTLASYGVNYYVAFVFDRNYSRQFSGACFKAQEPSIAGPTALRMRSEFCGQPLLEFPGFDGKYLIYRINPS